LLQGGGLGLVGCDQDDLIDGRPNRVVDGFGEQEQGGQSGGLDAEAEGEVAREERLAALEDAGLQALGGDGDIPSG